MVQKKIVVIYKNRIMVNALATIVLRVIRHVLFILGLNIILVPVNMKEKKNILVIAKKKNGGFSHGLVYGSI